MKLIISPAKTLDFETPAKTKKSSEPKFEKEVLQLTKKMQGYSQKQIPKMMDLSEKLAKLNYERFEGWASAPQKQAILAYMGDVYTGLDAKSFSEKDFDFAQKHLRIISGLYGLLKPLDLIKPYRLEMSTPIGLYDFWGDKLTKELGDDVVINLASSEYSSAVKPANMITANFYETKNGKPKMIGLFAKKARGMMARYIIQNQITEPEKIKKFSAGGYKLIKEVQMQQAIILLDKLRAQNLKLATAESCTGGMIASAITDISGSSDVFERGFVTYSNQSKIEMLGVSQKTLDEFGAVSEQTCREMVMGALKNSHATIAVATTGVAGPNGGSLNKPVGLVYIGVGTSERVRVIKFHFSGTRAEVRKQTAEKAIELIISSL